MKLELDAPNIGDLEKKYVSDSIDSGFVSTFGPFVPEFEERFAKYPAGMPRRKCGEFGIGYERLLRVTERKSTSFYSFVPIIQFNHDYFSSAENSSETVQSMHKKRMGLVRACDIPYWGKSAELVKKFQ